MKYNTIVYERTGGVATIAINRPEQRNSLTLETALEVYDAVKRIAADGEVLALVLRGVGRDFCCGADLKAPDNNVVAEASTVPQLDFYHVSTLLHEMKAVTIAAIRGGCAGAGFGWACACDLRVADDTAKINTAFLDVGVAGDMGVPWLLPRIVGSGRARGLSFYPRKVLAGEARDMGLLNEVWTSEAFEMGLSEMLNKLTGAAPQALAMLKSNFVEAERLGLESYIRLESERHNRLLQTHDRLEAFAAWVEKRPGRFKGY